ELWFPMDVMILHAGNHIFHVFAAILKEKSSVFADMFSFPQSESGTEVKTMEGTPVVRLHDDLGELEVFLKAIFDSNFFMPPPALVTLADIVGILRLAHKYDVHFLWCRALQHLERYYPTTLAAYINDTVPLTNIKFGFTSPLTNHLTIVEVATEVGALWLLPTAYYVVCAHDMADIV
ncbi:hypothetical protein B0H10DRAFT_1754839, partial [Mycena sp. CBHHK59/15]